MSHRMVFWGRFCINLPDGMDIMSGHHGVLTPAGAKYMAELIGSVDCLPADYSDCDFLLHLWMQAIALFLLDEIVEHQTGLTRNQLHRSLITPISTAT